MSPLLPGGLLAGAVAGLLSGIFGIGGGIVLVPALGLAATRFENACGHDGPGHRSSARDLLALTRAALAQPEVRRLAALEAVTLRTLAGRVLSLRTTNALLGRRIGSWSLQVGTRSRRVRAARGGAGR